MPLPPTLAEELRSAPFELILSSGFFGFYAHAGVMEALEEAQLMPSLIGGSSAGALASGLWAAGMSAHELRDRFVSLRREDFWDLDPRFGLHPEANGFGMLRGHAFDRLLEQGLGKCGVSDFSQCRVPLRVVVHDMDLNRTVVLDRGPLLPAVRASCSLPGLFQPVRIDGARYLDGGISDRAGIRAATPGARVLFHHLAPKSPWRWFWTSQTVPPTRPNTYILCAQDVPRLGPFRLERGAQAYTVARDMARRALHTAARAFRTP
jgi:NTE family protein